MLWDCRQVVLRKDLMYPCAVKLGVEKEGCKCPCWTATKYALLPFSQPQCDVIKIIGLDHTLAPSYRSCDVTRISRYIIIWVVLQKGSQKRDIRIKIFISEFTTESYHFEKFGWLETISRIKEDSSSGIKGATGVSRTPPLLIYLTLPEVYQHFLYYWRIIWLFFFDLRWIWSFWLTCESVQ